MTLSNFFLLMLNNNCFLQKIPPKYQNGPLQDYKVFLDGAQVEQTNSSEVLASFPVPCHGNHYVSVRGCNKQGCSPESPILIPNYKGNLKEISFFMLSDLFLHVLMYFLITPESLR